MGLIIAQMSVAGHSALPRDRFVNTLWFDDNIPDPLPGADAQQLATDLRDRYSEWLGSPSREIRVTLYDADAPTPRPQLASVDINTGQSAALPFPGEVALCLSFYADRNIPKRRGRIFLPTFALVGGLGGTPTQTQMNHVLDFADDLSELGGAAIDWVVHSPTDQNHYKVTHAWCDNEWDTQRSRGRKADDRVQRDVTG